jgi:hypothetical protein
MNTSPKGPSCYENWLAALRNKPLQWTVEFPLYSDVEIIEGGLTDGCGPYQLVNTTAFIFSREAPLRPVIVLRIDEHEEYEFGDMEHTETQNYHGGELCDEIAALVSLCFGIRLKAGEISRRFHPKGDPKGRPQFIGYQGTPIFSRNRRGAILPKAMKSCSIHEIPLLSQLPKLLPEEATTLVRAARMYQEAVWVSEMQPHLAWLLLVSAVEIVANYHYKDYLSTESLVEMLEFSRPNLVNLLRKSGGEELAVSVAQELIDILRSGRKFIDFIIEFAPPPPEQRPPVAFQTAWETDKDSGVKPSRKSLKTIYHHRSVALHQGIPFPLPMCEPPLRIENEFAEIPSGFATNGKGGTWVHKKDVPMQLHVFEYIVRNALLKWWASMLLRYKNG